MLQMVLWFGWAELMFRYWIFAALHFTNSAAWRAALPCRICCRFFIHPTAGPRGARGSRTRPSGGGKCFWGYTFHFQESPFPTSLSHTSMLHFHSATNPLILLAMCFNFVHLLNLFTAKLMAFIKAFKMTLGEGLPCIKTLKTCQISMDGKGRAIDNVFVERFFHTIKYEKLYLIRLNTGQDVVKACDEFINYYNCKRDHSSLQKRTPENVYKSAA